MKCPICKNDCYDNRTNKKSPTGPDFKCKACKAAGWIDRKDAGKVNFTSEDKTTRMSVALEGSYQPAPATAPAAKAVQSVVPQLPKDVSFSGETVSKSVYSAWAKDLVAIAIKGGKSADEVMAIYKDIHAKLGAYLNSAGVAVKKSAETVQANSEDVDLSEIEGLLEGEVEL